MPAAGSVACSLHIGPDGSPRAVPVAELGPDVDPFILHLFAALAEKERAMIARRTKAAKAHGVKLGGSQARGSARSNHSVNQGPCRPPCSQHAPDNPRDTARGRYVSSPDRRCLLRTRHQRMRSAWYARSVSTCSPGRRAFLPPRGNGPGEAAHSLAFKLSQSLRSLARRAPPPGLRWPP
jgi:hypothetical protein